MPDARLWRREITRDYGKPERKPAAFSERRLIEVFANQREKKKMKTLVYLIAVLLPFATPIHADDITLADGKTIFHNAKIISHDAASVSIKHSTGHRSRYDS